MEIALRRPLPMQLNKAGWKAFREWAVAADYQAAKQRGEEDYRCQEIKDESEAGYRSYEVDPELRDGVFELVLEEWKNTLTGHYRDKFFTMEEGD